jgi:hypothetical protein
MCLGLNILLVNRMKALLLFIGLCILFVLCWPLAILALILLPMVWLLSLPLRLIGITVEAVFGLIRGLLLLPARLLDMARRDGKRTEAA